MFVDFLDTPIGCLEIVADQTYVTDVRFVAQAPKLCKPNAVTKLCKVQLADYLQGARKRFDVPIRLEGTAFQKSVWTALQTIPFGHTRSFQSLAVLVDSPRAQRAVGSANGKNRIAIIVPCHRIIKTNGQHGGYAYGMSKKAWLLQHELGLM